MTSVGIEPTTSGLDLPLLCRLSYEVGQRKSGTIKVVNRGEEKVRVHIYVVPRSTMNTNGVTICVHSATVFKLFGVAGRCRYFSTLLLLFPVFLSINS